MIIEDEELRNLYQVSSEERLQRLEVGLLHLEEASHDAALLEQLLRDIHSLKGDSRSVGVEAVATLAQAIEETLKGINCQTIPFTTPVANCLYQGLRAIAQLIQAATTGESSEIDFSSILLELIEIASKPGNSKPAQQQYTNHQFVLPLIEDDELNKLYRTTSQEKLQRLELGLLRLEQHPEDISILERLVRDAHGLVGDSRSVGVVSVEAIAFQIEEIFNGIKNQTIVFTSQVSRYLYQSLDVITQLVHEAVTGQPGDIDPAAILHQWLDIQSEVSTTPQPTISLSNALSTTATLLIEDQELQTTYKVTSQERLQRLETGFMHLEQYPEDITTLNALLRELHSLKGDSRSLGVNTVEVIVHHIEDVITKVKNQIIPLTPQVSEAYYQGLDAIAQLVHQAVSNESGRIDTAQVLHRLVATLTSVSAIRHEQPQPSIQPIQEPILQSSETLEPYEIDTIRVSTRDLDILMRQIEELTVTKLRITQTIAEIEEVAILWQEAKEDHRHQKSLNAGLLNQDSNEERLERMLNVLRNSSQENRARLDSITRELGDKIRTLRLLPLSTVLRMFPRMVRDIAKQQSKEVELILEGGDITVDKHILEKIRDILIHLVRNAIDHGIELPNERSSQGKPPVAKIWIRGHQTATSILIEVADDGRGLNVEKIRQTAIKRKLHSSEELDAMNLNQIHNLIFTSGFSTRSFITEISGRGIGLDVVHTNVNQLKGSLQVESTDGQGCVFRIQISKSLTTTDVFLVEVQGFVYALPIQYVQTSLLISLDEITSLNNQAAIALNEQLVTLADLAHVLDLPIAINDTVSKPETLRRDARPCIILKDGTEQIGLFVDRFLDTQEVVMQPQSQLLKRVKYVAGATILGTGEVCIVLNPPDLLKFSQKSSASLTFVKPTQPVLSKPVVLLVEDSVPVRTQEKRLLENAGYEVVVAVDGLDGYNKLKSQNFNIVVTDVEMPNLDGFSLTAKIRQHQEYDDVPIVIVTTLNSDEDRLKGETAGANAYLLKGKFNQDLLLETLNKLV